MEYGRDIAMGRCDPGACRIGNDGPAAHILDQ